MIRHQIIISTHSPHIFAIFPRATPVFFIKSHFYPKLTPFYALLFILGLALIKNKEYLATRLAEMRNLTVLILFFLTFLKDVGLRCCDVYHVATVRFSLLFEIFISEEICGRTSAFRRERRLHIAFLGELNP